MRRQPANKEEYRRYFEKCKPYLKLKTFCDMCDVSQSALSKFTEGPEFEGTMSLENLERVYIVIQGYLKTIS